MIEKILNLGEQPVLALFGDEPAIDAQGIITTWATAWPRVIAKVWKLESKVRDIFNGLTQPQIEKLPKYVQSYIKGTSGSALPALTCPVVRYLLTKELPGAKITSGENNFRS
jgi:hypothetical protein